MGRTEAAWMLGEQSCLSSPQTQDPAPDTTSQAVGGRHSKHWSHLLSPRESEGSGAAAAPTGPPHHCLPWEGWGTRSINLSED